MHYSFGGGEEVFLFALTKIALGQPNTYLYVTIYSKVTQGGGLLDIDGSLLLITKGLMISWGCRGSAIFCRSFLTLRVLLNTL